MKKKKNNWTTPCADDTSSRTKKYAQGGTPLSLQVQWATPSLSMLAGYSELMNCRSGREGYGHVGNHLLRQCVDMENKKSEGDMNWPTPNASDADGGGMRKDGTPAGKQLDLRRFIQMKPDSWRTPAASDGEGGIKTKESIDGDPAPKIKLRDHVNHNISDTSKQKLNPNWVEQLMGLPPKWTQLSDAEPGDNRIDRLRLLGNGVMPQTAEKAFRTLLERIK